jgi:hypothetical protein
LLGLRFKGISASDIVRSFRKKKVLNRRKRKR